MKIYVTTSIPAWLNTTYEVEAENVETAEQIISERIGNGSLGEHSPIDEAFIEDQAAVPTIIASEETT